MAHGRGQLLWEILGSRSTLFAELSLASRALWEIGAASAIQTALWRRQ